MQSEIETKQTDNEVSNKEALYMDNKGMPVESYEINATYYDDSSLNRAPQPADTVEIVDSLDDRSRYKIAYLNDQSQTFSNNFNQNTTTAVPNTYKNLNSFELRNLTESSTDSAASVDLRRFGDYNILF